MTTRRVNLCIRGSDVDDIYRMMEWSGKVTGITPTFSKVALDMLTEGLKIRISQLEE